MIQIKKDITIIKCNSTFVYYRRLHEMIVRKEKVVFTAGGEREFHVPASVSMVKLEVKSGSVKVEGRLTKESDYV